jgi:hypothetical protein
VSAGELPEGGQDQAPFCFVVAEAGQAQAIAAVTDQRHRVQVAADVQKIG